MRYKIYKINNLLHRHNALYKKRASVQHAHQRAFVKDILWTRNVLRLKQYHISGKVDCDACEPQPFSRNIPQESATPISSSTSCSLIASDCHKFDSNIHQIHQIQSFIYWETSIKSGSPTHNRCFKREINKYFWNICALYWFQQA